MKGPGVTHVSQEPYFLWLVDLFLETTFQTEVGQLLDSICANCELEESVRRAT